MLIGFTKDCECPTEFMHPNATGRKVPCVGLDHYATKCPDPPMPRILAIVIADECRKERYGTSNPFVSATALTRCPLQMYLEYHTEYVEDPLAVRWMLRGSFAHNDLLKRVAAKPGWLVEQQYNLDLGFPFYFTPDAYEIKTRTLYDLKTQKEFAVEKKGRMTDAECLADRFVVDNVTQVNVYAWALGEVGMPVDRAELQYWDGQLRVRRLNVPLDTAKAGALVTTRGAYIYDLLTNKIPLGKIEPDMKKVWNHGKSPVCYLIEKELKRRGVTV